jgi:hypothetical protein
MLWCGRLGGTRHAAGETPAPQTSHHPEFAAEILKTAFTSYVAISLDDLDAQETTISVELRINEMGGLRADLCRGEV